MCYFLLLLHSCFYNTARFWFWTALFGSFISRLSDAVGASVLDYITVVSYLYLCTKRADAFLNGSLLDVTLTSQMGSPKFNRKLIRKLSWLVWRYSYSSLFVRLISFVHCEIVKSIICTATVIYKIFSLHDTVSVLKGLERHTENRV